jgi:hypothetical protein
VATGQITEELVLSLLLTAFETYRERRTNPHFTSNRARNLQLNSTAPPPPSPAAVMSTDNVRLLDELEASDQGVETPTTADEEDAPPPPPGRHSLRHNLVGRCTLCILLAPHPHRRIG